MAMASARVFPLVSHFAVGEEGDLLCGHLVDLGGIAGFLLGFLVDGFAAESGIFRRNDQ